MKNLSAFFAIFTFSVFSVSMATFSVSCLNHENEVEHDLDNEDGYIDIQDVFLNTKKPLIMQNKDQWIEEVAEIFANINKNILQEKDWIVTTSSVGKTFAANEEVIISPVETSKFLYGKPLFFSVEKFSLNSYYDNLILLKPFPGQKIEVWRKNFIKGLNKINKYLKIDVDYYLKVNSVNNEFFLKNDSIKIFSSASSKILSGNLEFVINICDLATLDVSSLIPRNNYTFEYERNLIADFLKSKTGRAEYEKDYAVNFSIKKNTFKDGDWISISSLDGSTLLEGTTKKLIVKTFNIKDIGDVINEIHHGDLKETVIAKIKNRIYKNEYNAEENIDFKIEINTAFDTVQVNDEIVIEISKDSNFIIGDNLKIKVPKISIKIFEDQILDYSVLMGKTEINDITKNINDVISNNIRKFSFENDIKIKLVNQKPSGVITGDSEIIVLAATDSDVFLRDNYEIKISTKKIKSQKLFDFINQSIESMTSSKNDVLVHPITVGTKKSTIDNIINSILSSDNEYSILKPGIDYALNYTGDSDELLLGDKIKFEILDSSQFLVSGSTEIELFNYTWNDMETITGNRLNIYGGMSGEFLYELIDSHLGEMFNNYNPNNVFVEDDDGNKIKRDSATKIQPDTALLFHYNDNRYFNEEVVLPITIKQYVKSENVLNLDALDTLVLPELSDYQNENDIILKVLNKLYDYKEINETFVNTIISQIWEFLNLEYDDQQNSERISELFGIKQTSYNEFELYIKNNRFYTFLSQRGIYINNHLRMTNLKNTLITKNNF